METSIIILLTFLISWCFIAGRFSFFFLCMPNLFCLLFLFRNQTVSFANPEAKRLYEELIKVRAYNKLIRPVKNNSEKLTVYLGLRLTQLLDVVR